ncbi:MAG: type II secretion system protein [Thermoguttaceae bacterium]
MRTRPEMGGEAAGGRTAGTRYTVHSTQYTALSTQYPAPSATGRFIRPPNLQSLIPNSQSRARGFTLIELLVTIVVIGMLAGISLAALRKTQQAARLAHTKATIAKLDRIIMAKYESYRTRRVPLNFSSYVTPSDTTAAIKLAKLRMFAIRDLMRMEMPEGWPDVSNDVGQSQMDVGQLAGLSSSVHLPEPALHRIYRQKMTSAPVDHDRAKTLYLIVMTGNPENRALFSQDEIADVDGDGYFSFIDGWGKPITFFRWAVGFTPWSDIQINDTAGLNQHHDPFDPRGVEPGAFQLFPLILAGVIGQQNSNGTQVDNYGVNFGSVQQSLDPYVDDPTIGQVITGFPITNHHIDQR